MSEARKRPAVGIDNFEKLRTNDFYYVDKTELISELMDNWAEVNLFTRPRRFGKTLNMSMLKYFFEIGSDKALFDGLAISRNTQLCERHMGKYPVVSITLKGVDGLTFEDAYGMLCDQIFNEAIRLQFLLDSSLLTDKEKQPFLDILERRYDPAGIKGSIRMFSSLLEKHYGQKVIILIDEYDVPLDKAYQHGYYEQMVDLIRGMLGAALKGNNSLFFAVLTGCLRVSKESIFTGLNNLMVHSISDIEYDEYFGFTDQEVGEMLAYYGLGKYHDEARKWYDGYRFGEQEVYCPWDVINYCQNLRTNPKAVPQAYWLNTSGNAIVRQLIEKSTNNALRMDVGNLIEGRAITKRIKEQLTYGEIDKNVDNIWSLLYMTGYLTTTQSPSGRMYELCIPNMEVRQIFVDQVLAWFEDIARTETGKLTKLYAAFESGDVGTITDYLNEQLLSTISFYDTNEAFYHGFLMALLNTCESWNVHSNRETGRGRSDITAERMDYKLGFVVEVKNVRAEKELDAACDAAMKQIEERDYTAEMRRYGIQEIWTYGIAFWGKKCRVKAKRM